MRVVPQRCQFSLQQVRFLAFASIEVSANRRIARDPAMDQAAFDNFAGKSRCCRGPSTFTVLGGKRTHAPAAGSIAIMSQRHESRRTANLGILLALVAAGCSSSSDNKNTVPPFTGSLQPSGSNSSNSAPNGSTSSNGSDGTSGSNGPSTSGTTSGGANEGNPNVTGVAQTNPATGGSSTGTQGGMTATGTMTSTTPVDPNAPAPKDLNCGNGLTIPAANVISDFNTPTPIMYQQADRGGTTWRGYGPSDTDPSTPGVGSSALAIDTTQSGPCNSGGALHVSSPGNTVFGVGISINFKQDATPGVSSLYDATADSFTGVGFFAQCKQEVKFTLLKFSDDATDSSVANPACKDGPVGNQNGPACLQYEIKNAVLLSNGWTHYQIYFDDTLVDATSPTAGTKLHTNALTAFQIQMNSQSATQANPFDCLIDDVHFLSDPPPTTPPPTNVTTVAGNTIAPGGYYTKGNQIFDSSGNVHIFKGLGRPSMEFDPAGQGITRGDVERMKATGANVIRWSLSEGYWLTTHPQYSPNYKAYVDRAVQWTLQNGMDAILDLHWSGSPMAGQQMMADREALTFWQEVATQYKGDGRVLFELYNEPHDVSNAVWLKGDGNTYAGMQEMYTAVRNTGANNLVLVGGLDFANDIDTPVTANPVTGTNIVYVTHPYIWKPRMYANTAAKFPVIATEFGDADVDPSHPGPNDCSTTPYTSTIADFTTRGMSWTSYAWFADPKRCSFPALIETFDGTPTPPGMVVFAALKQ
jgi:endoglucanase